MICAKYYRNFSSGGLGSSAYALGKTSLPLLVKAAPSFGYPSARNDFLDKFSNEINRLNSKERTLALKLSKAQRKPLSDEQKRQLLAEQKLIEQGQKYLSIIVQAMQQSMQSIAANFR